MADRIHYVGPNSRVPTATPLCGAFLRDRAQHATRDPAATTCKRCRASLRADGLLPREPAPVPALTLADVTAWLAAQDIGPRPWRDGDPRCHCTHCDACGRLYRTADIGDHRTLCPVAKVRDAFRMEVSRG